MNIKLVIEYDGEFFHGWQRQVTGHATVQEEIEKALSEISGQKITLFGAGRTDSGVHACAQVANFEVNAPVPPERWRLALNTKLPHSIRVLESSVVPSNFHSQRKAVGKIYEYRILNRSFASALDRRVYFWPHKLDWDKMRIAAAHFVGEHDFGAFQSGKSTVKSTFRKIKRLEIIEDASSSSLYRIVVEGNGFLKQMVRNLVGTLMEVGQNLRDPNSIPELFLGKSREFAGRAAPARGLFLVKVIYDREWSLTVPKEPWGAHATPQ